MPPSPSLSLYIEWRDLFGFNVLELGIGLILFFLIVSLIGRAAREAIETIMMSRAGDPECGLRMLLYDPTVRN